MRTVYAVGLGLGLALLAGGAGIARAQGAGRIDYIELYQQLDANGDGVIDRGEVPDSGREAFEQLLKNADGNKDGKIDRDEYREVLTAVRDAFNPLGGRFAEIDKDGDGKISKGEFTGPEAVFARIDSNGDGAISREEAARVQPEAGAGAAGANNARFAQFAERIRAMDQDKDGKVSRDEFTGPPAAFERFDADKDGFLSRNEIPGAPATAAPDRGQMRERLQAMDRDKDGKVSKDEFQGNPELFDRLDTNKDGVLSREDNPDAAPGTGTRNRPGGAPGANPGERLRAMDKDKDGKISKDEFTGPAQLFERLDANSDGFLTPDEVRSPRSQSGKKKD